MTARKAMAPSTMTQITLPSCLTANAILSSTGNAAISLDAKVDGAFDLTVNTTGATTFGGVVGGTTALTSLTTNAGGTFTYSQILANTNSGANSLGLVKLGSGTLVLNADAGPPMTAPSVAP